MGTPVATTSYLYMVIWTTTQLLFVADELVFGYGGHGGVDARPTIGFVDWYVQTPLLMVSWWNLLIRRSPRARYWCIMAHSLDLAIRIWRMPFVWDHEQWAMLFELTFLVVATKTTLDDADEALFLRACRYQFGILYSAATFWKLNPSFMDPSTSCGTVVITEFLVAYMPWFPAALVAPWAAVITIVVEGLIALLMFSHNRHSNIRAAAVLLGGLFHWSIFVMPVNAAGGFSMDCVSRFVLLFTTNEVQRGLQVFQTSRATYLVASAAAFIGVMVAVRGITNPEPLDFAYVWFCALLSFYGLLLWENGRCSREERLSSGTDAPLSDPTFRSQLLHGSIVTITFVHAYALTILGLEHMGGEFKPRKHSR